MDNAGWGVDEDQYTTKLDKSNISAEMERRAEMIANQIMAGKGGGNLQNGSSGNRSSFNHQNHQRSQQQYQHNDNVASNLQSQEQALEYLRMQHEHRNLQQSLQQNSNSSAAEMRNRQQQQQQKPRYATQQDEINTHKFLTGQCNMVRSLLRIHVRVYHFFLYKISYLTKQKKKFIENCIRNHFYVVF